MKEKGNKIMDGLLEAVGNVEISYSVDCPNCSETQYSDSHYKEWNDLEYGDGYPHGVLQCDECEERFYVTISG